MRICILLLFGLWANLPFEACAQDAGDLSAAQELLIDDFPELVAGFRVQIPTGRLLTGPGAFASESLAVQMKDQLQYQITEKVHIVFTDDSWKVRVGDFLDSTEAKTFLQERLAPVGYADAWVVPDKIPVPLDKRTPPKMAEGFRLQVEVLSDKDKALERGRSLNYLLPACRVHVLHLDELYKIQIGDFKNREEAEEWKERLASQMGIETWIIQSRIWDEPIPPPSELPFTKDIFDYDD